MRKIFVISAVVILFACICSTCNTWAFTVKSNGSGGSIGSVPQNAVDAFSKPAVSTQQSTAQTPASAGTTQGSASGQRVNYSGPTFTPPAPFDSARLAQIEKKVAKTQADGKKIGSDVKKLGVRTSVVEDEVKAQKAEISKINTSIDGQASRVSNLEGRMTEIESKLAKTDQNVENLTGRVNTLDTKIDTEIKGVREWANKQFSGLADDIAMSRYMSWAAIILAIIMSIILLIGLFMRGVKKAINEPEKVDESKPPTIDAKFSLG